MSRAELRLSTVCADCRDDATAVEEAEEFNREWEKRPIEVDDRKCRECRRRRHWWWFIKSDPRKRS